MAKLLDQYGREIQKPDKVLVGGPTDYGNRAIQSDVSELIDLDPRTIRNYLLEAETGSISSQCALFEEMERRDAELDGHLRTRKMGVASLDYEIVPADDSAAADKAADFCQDMIDNIGANPPPGRPLTGIRSAIFDLLDAIPKGFSALEIEWATSEKQWAPTMLHWRPQRYFGVGDDGMTLHLLGDNYDEQIQLNPTNWIIHVAQARSGFLNRWSLLKSCTRPFIMRFFGYKDWLAFAEVYGMPPRIGHLREGVNWDSAEANELKGAVRAMGVDMAAVVREGNTIEVLDVTRAGEGTIFQTLLDHAEKELTKAILGQLLTSGGEGGGSYALGKVQNLIRGDLLETDALGLDETLSKELLAPSVALNLGPNAPAPHWHTIVAEPEDLEKLSNVVGNLVERANVETIPVSWVHEQFGIPEPEEGEECLKPKAPGGQMFSSGRVTGRKTHNLLGDAMFQAEARIHRMGPGTFYDWLCQQDPGDWRVIDELAGSWLAEKRVATQTAWNALSPAGKQRAWWVTGLGEQPTALVGRELSAILREGQTENEFLNRIEALGLSVPEGVEAAAGQMPAWQARLVHRNNRWTAENAGQYLRLQADRDVRPYGEWLCHSPCPICQPLCGNMAPLDGSFFGAYWPQIHHGCQCEVVSVSADEVEGDGEMRSRLDQADPVPIDAPNEFAYHPGDAFYLSAEGGAPRTDMGLRDAEILAGLKTLEAYT